MTTAAPIPEHIQKLIEERAQVAAEAAQLEWKAREKRVEVRQLSERIESEMRQHAEGNMGLLRILLQPPPAEFYEPEPGKRVRAKTEKSKPPAAQRKGDDERARLIAIAVEKGDWAEVTRLSTAKL